MDFFDWLEIVQRAQETEFRMTSSYSIQNHPTTKNGIERLNCTACGGTGDCPRCGGNWQLTPDEAERGGDPRLTRDTRQFECDLCHGGARPGCAYCGRHHGDCFDCNGYGKNVSGEECSTCGGSGESGEEYEG